MFNYKQLVYVLNQRIINRERKKVTVWSYQIQEKEHPLGETNPPWKLIKTNLTKNLISCTNKLSKDK